MTIPGDAMPKPVDEPLGVPAARRSRWQFGLRAMLAVTALVAVWTAHVNNLREIHRLEGRIESLVLLVPELVVVDPSRFALVRLEDRWYDEHRWELFIPEGRFVLKLATRGVGQTTFPADHRSASIPSGRHLLELRQSESGDGRRIDVLVDGSPLLQAVEPADWSPRVGWSSSGMGDGRSEPRRTDEPLILLHVRFHERIEDASGWLARPPANPCNGIMIWIERAGEGPHEPGGDSSKTPTGRAASPSPTSYLE